MEDKVIVRVVDSAARAMEEIHMLHRQGFLSADIFVLAHDKKQTDVLADAADANTVTMEEEGLLQSLANLFRSRGDELRSKMEAMGCTEQEAARYEAELDRGKIIVITRIGVSQF